MRGGRVLMLVAIIILLIVLAAYLMLGGKGEPEQPEEGGQAQSGLSADMVYVVVAGQDISRGSIIPEQDGVVVTQMPRDLVIETMISGEDEEELKSRVVGRRARMDIARGIFITEGMLTEEAGDLLGVGSDAAMAIEPGYTAISIPWWRGSGVAYAIRKGDQVDVLISFLLISVDADFQSQLPNETTAISALGGTPQLFGPHVTAPIYPGLQDSTRRVGGEYWPYGRVDIDPELDLPIHVIPSESQRPRLVSQRLIENATVLEVGTFSLEDIMPNVVQTVTQTDQGEEAVQPETQNEPDIITLIVTPQDALALNWAIKAGADLVLTLRSPDDTTITETSSITLQYLLESYNITVPAKLPFAITPSYSAPLIPFTDVVDAIEAISE
jgi:Flp pilus assembly protein CpaB